MIRDIEMEMLSINYNEMTKYLHVMIKLDEVNNEKLRKCCQKELKFQENL